MLEIYPFIQELVACENTSKKIEVFQRYNPSNCRVFVFDEEVSNFADFGKNISSGNYETVGLGDYRKLWIIDQSALKNEVQLAATKVVNYDLNIFSHMNRLFCGRSIPNREDFIAFLSEIKMQNLTNNISTALMERYSTTLKPDILAEMISSYVYFDSIPFEEFLSQKISMLSSDKYEWMKQIWCASEKYLGGNDDTQHYEAKEFYLNKLPIYFELEMILLILCLRNDEATVRTFQKLQLGAKHLKDKIYNTAWDIYHVRLLEQEFQNDNSEIGNNVTLPYFATADVGLLNVLKSNPIKILVVYKGIALPIRKFNRYDFFTDEELQRNGDNTNSRVKKVQKVDFKMERENLFDELSKLSSR